MATTQTNLFKIILQNIACDRYADRDEAYREIDCAFESDQITQTESRRLETAVEWMIPE